MDRQDLSHLIADRFDLTITAADEAVSIYLSQIGVDYYSDLSDDDVDTVVEAVAASLPEVSAGPLDRVADTASAHRSAEDAADITRADRDAAIRAAAAAGVPKTQIADAADISRQAIYDILE